MMEFSCPSCNIDLQAQEVDDIRLWKCASCRGFAISLPIVRKELETETFKNIWKKLTLGEFESGRPCPGCRHPLKVVEADAEDGAILIDVCRTCHILWFDDKEFSDLPKSAPRISHEAEQSGGRFLTPEELVFAEFKADQYQRRSFLYKLLDGSISKELGLDSFFGDFLDKGE
jgi:Zn-finger nucleic acid-binding protein